MKVEMLRPTRVDGSTVRPGEVVEVSGPEARVLIHARKARPVREEATAGPPERAVQPEGEPRGPDQEGWQDVEPSEELAELVGDGPATALAQAGYRSVQAGRQAVAGGVDLTAIDGVGPATVRKLEAAEPVEESDEGESEDESDEEESEE